MRCGSHVACGRGVDNAMSNGLRSRSRDLALRLLLPVILIVSWYVVTERPRAVSPGDPAIAAGRAADVRQARGQRRVMDAHRRESRTHLLCEPGGAGTRGAAGLGDGPLPAVRENLRWTDRAVPADPAARLGAVVDPVVGHRHAVGRVHHVPRGVLRGADQHHRRRPRGRSSCTYAPPCRSAPDGGG